MINPDRILPVIVLATVIAVLLQVPLFAREQLVINADMQYDWAQKNLDEKDFNTSLIEFKRFIHFFPGDARVPKARFQTGICLYHLKRFHEAAKVFNAVILAGTDMGLKNQSVLMQSAAFHRMGNLGYAKLVLINYSKLTRDESMKNKIYSALCDLHVASFKGTNKEELKDARKNLLKISDKDAKAYEVRQRLLALDQALASPEKNPVLSGILSIIPGAGFFYCERYQDALVAFLLNTGLIYAAYESFDQGNEALGGVVAFVETGFYSGNIYGAVTAAHRHNFETKIRILGRSFTPFSKADIEDKAWMIGLTTTF